MTILETSSDFSCLLEATDLLHHHHSNHNNPPLHSFNLQQQQQPEVSVDVVSTDSLVTYSNTDITAVETSNLVNNTTTTTFNPSLFLCNDDELSVQVQTPQVYHNQHSHSTPQKLLFNLDNSTFDSGSRCRNLSQPPVSTDYSLMTQSPTSSHPPTIRQKSKRRLSTASSISNITSSNITITANKRQRRISNSSMNQNTPGSSSPPSAKKNTEKNERPHVSYAGMIVQAIVSSPGARMTLRGIYEWVLETYPYFQSASKNWQNSIRHNLSIHNHFVRLPSENEKIATFWTVEPRFLQKFEFDSIVPQGTFNILHGYISKLIKDGPDNMPVPNIEQWPVKLGQRQVVQLKKQQPSNTFISNSNSATTHSIPIINNHHNSSIHHQHHHHNHIPNNIIQNDFLFPYSYNPPQTPISSTSSTATIFKTDDFNMENNNPNDFLYNNNNNITFSMMNNSNDDSQDVLLDLPPRHQLMELLNLTTEMLSSSTSTLSSTPPDCDINRLLEIAPCDFYQGMELLTCDETSFSDDYFSDGISTFPLSGVQYHQFQQFQHTQQQQQWYHENKSFLLFMADE